LRAALRKAGQREVGGILMAKQLRPGHFRIVDFSLDAFSGSHTRFRRDPKTHQKVLDAFFQRTGCDYQRFNYLGEWHSHPSFSVQPSLEDIETMTDIVENGNSTITFAVLLIVRLRWRPWIDCSLTVLQRTKIHERWNSPEGFDAYDGELGIDRAPRRRLGLSWLPQRIASMPLRQRATQARQARSRGRTEKLYRSKHRFNFRFRTARPS
jgi:integrative and conjugative element protein (TIGR02256 family)